MIGKKCLVTRCGKLLVIEHLPTSSPSSKTLPQNSQTSKKNYRHPPKKSKKNVQKKSTQNTHTPNHWGYDITRNSFGEASQTYLIQQAHDSLPVAIHGTIEAHDIGLNVAVLGRFRSDQRPEVPPGWRFFPSQKQTPPKLTRVLDTERIFQHRYINHFARSMVPQYSCADSVSLTQGPPATL